MGTKITDLATITDVASNDILTGVDVSDTTGSANGTNKKFTKASLLSGVALEAYQLSGWNPLGETLAYVSVDDPTGVVKVVGVDVTDKLSVGMRLMFTNGGNVIKAIITAIAFSTDTTITFLHEIDPTDSLALTLMGNSAITLPYFSSQKAPYGFPLDPRKWCVRITDGTDAKQTNPTSTTYYNLGNISINVPIGVWKLSFQTNYEMKSSNAVTLVYGNVGLGIANNSVVDNFECYIVESSSSGVVRTTNSVYREDLIALTTKTTYYLNARASMTLGATGYILFAGLSSGNTIICAVCAYL